MINNVVILVIYYTQLSPYTEGADYQGISTVVTFPMNADANFCHDFFVNVTDDDEFGESLESFQLLTSDNSSDAMPVLERLATATGLIIDHDLGKCTHSRYR